MAKSKQGFPIFFNQVGDELEYLSDEELGSIFRQIYYYAEKGEPLKPYEDCCLNRTMKRFQNCIDNEKPRGGKREGAGAPIGNKNALKKEQLCYGDGTPMASIEEVEEIIKRKTNINQ